MNDFPYTDFHELNLTWLIKKMIELNSTVKNFVSLNTIKYADPIQWDITKQYETNTVVIDPNTGTAYISVQPVPSGVELSNPDYWTVVFNLSQIISAINNNLTVHDAGMSPTATFESSMGDWVLWNNVLYIVTTDIVPGTAYVVGTNIKQISVEEENEVVYYPTDRKLTIHGKISDYSEIVTAGDYHIYRPTREAIEIRKVE